PAAERPLAYRWLAGIYAAEIGVETLIAYRSGEGRAILGSFATEPSLEPLVAAISEAAQHAEYHDALALSLKLATAYTRLFLGAGGPHSAPPYESAYSSERGTLFQAPTAEMSDLLRELDLAVPENLKEPADHIAIQLNVLAEFAARTILVMTDGDRRGEMELRSQQTVFIDTHLLNWLPAFRDDCVANDPSGFYGTVSKATVAFLERDKVWLAGGGNAA
ncbi:MAG: molecular chaperone TorD, partial [Rhodospirillales bacterium]|nr:molecular chaperone TorD [Rhodospirillales bacterium]